MSRPKHVPWKALAARLKLQRDRLLKQSADQRRLLIWLLDQIVLERLAEIALQRLQDQWIVEIPQTPDPKRGQA